MHFIMTFIAYKSPKSDEKWNCNISFVLYSRILFTGTTLAPSSFSCSLPDLYIPMRKSPPRTSRCPVSCSFISCRSANECITMYFSVITHSHSRIVNRWQLQIFSKPNISRVWAMYRRFPQIVSLIVHTVRLSLAWTGVCTRCIRECDGL